MKKKLIPGFAGIITGASSGIGKALALKLAKQYSAKLILNGRTEATLVETKKLVEEAGGQAYFVIGDMSDPIVQKKLIDSCLEHFNQIDLLVNNAGLSKPGSLLKLNSADWRYVFDVNFFAPLNMIYLTLPYFVEKHAGKIVNISSVAGKVVYPGSVCYASSKFALTGMSNGMAAELAREGIDVITVCPGFVRTEFFSKNRMSDEKNPTLIAQKNDLKGWLMRNVLSISSEQVADDIIASLNKGGSSEMVLTIPGVVAERMTALFPSLMAYMAKQMPAKYIDNAKRSNAI